MAKTPLLRMVQRAIAVARRSIATGVPADELAAMDAERRALSRRSFLAMSAAAAAAGATGCSDTLPAPPVATNVKIAIVGGGMAGVHCAYRLKKRGVDATIFEASKRLGGRMWSDRDTFAQPDAMHCELGGELIDTDHDTMHALAKELSIDLLDYTEDDASLTSDLLYAGGAVVPSKDILAGFVPIAMAVDAARATLTDPMAGVTYTAPNGGEALDAMSISQWLDSVKAEGPARTLVELAFVIEYGLDLSTSNALNLVLLIGTDTTKGIQLFGASDELFHTKTGNDTFITKLAAALDPSQIVYESPLESIRESTDGGVLLTFNQNGKRQQFKAEHAVLALPFSILRGLDYASLTLSNAKAAAIAEQGMGQNAKLMAGFSSRVWRSTAKSNGTTYSDTGYQNTWETSRLQPGKSGILTNYTGAGPAIAIGQGTPQDRLASFLAQLDKVFPGAKAASNGKVARMHWPSYALTKGSYSAYLVGQYTKFSGAEIERVDNIHFCGEHTSLSAQGYMEGAAATGAAAADEILMDLGIDTMKTMAFRPDATLSPGEKIEKHARRIRTQQGRARRPLR